MIDAFLYTFNITSNTKNFKFLHPFVKFLQRKWQLPLLHEDHIVKACHRVVTRLFQTYSSKEQSTELKELLVSSLIQVWVICRSWLKQMANKYEKQDDAMDWVSGELWKWINLFAHQTTLRFHKCQYNFFKICNCHFFVVKN